MINSNTNIKIETSKGLEIVNLETEFLKNRKIFLSGPVDMEMADDFIRQMMYLEEEGDEDINIYINGPGGDVLAGLLIYDAIQSARSTINIYCTGVAYSMSAMILVSAEKGHRFILPHSEVMIHEPMVGGGVGGNASTVKHISDSISKTKDTTIEILMKHTGKSKEEIEKAISFDNFMSAEEAVEFGICDEVITKL